MRLHYLAVEVKLKAIYKDNADTMKGIVIPPYSSEGRKNHLKRDGEILGKETIDLTYFDTRGYVAVLRFKFQRPEKK